MESQKQVSRVSIKKVFRNVTKLDLDSEFSDLDYFQIVKKN